MLKNEPIKLPDILNESILFVDLNKYKAEQPQNLRGNSLEISDESDFLATEKTKKPIKRQSIAMVEKNVRFQEKNTSRQN